MKISYEMQKVLKKKNQSSLYKLAKSLSECNRPWHS